MNAIERRPGGNTTITAGSVATAGSGGFPYARWAGGCITVAATNGATLINWHGAPDAVTTPVQVYESGNAVTTNVTVGVHPVPDACFACAYVYPIITGSSSMSATVSVKG